MIEFKLNEKENELAEEFLQEHRHPEVHKGAIGGHMEFKFIPTSVGDICIVKCSVCDSEKNITDYDSW